ncbi:MAG TPA: type I-U CRISPR-associated protein Csb2 [Phycisphaerales bacterium]|nr:type I-U CRISPR-associated protein Csb2 [Phycisphaerales bacterium]HMP36848.1 type I-U CRISPR-associated protein Csb2 [Phycisphaerales bacterium]
MPSHLLVSVTFLQPTCHARMGKDDAAGNEWPPSPLRLFQAMVAGAAARWGGGNERPRGSLTAEAPVAALKWLERLCASSPPTIVAPRAITGQPVPRYVPNNSADLVAAKWAGGDGLAAFEDRTLKVFRPTYLLDGQTVHYRWPLEAPDEHEARRHEHTLVATARCIVAMGWGIDVAMGDARIVSAADPDSLVGEQWVPGSIGPAGLRLPVSGTLDGLFARHAAFLDRLKSGIFHPVAPLRAFTTVEYRRASAVPPRHFAAFLLRPAELDTGYASCPATYANRVSAMLRHVACKAAQGDIDPRGWRTDEWSLRVVAGHGPEGSPKRRATDDPHPRLSYLSLPSIGHAHADGMIRRVIVAEPFGGDGQSARWAAQRLAGAELLDEDSGRAVARLDPVEPDEAEFGRVFPRYAPRSGREAAVCWVSVTPVVLPGYDDNKSSKRERLLLDSLRHAGIDPIAVASIESRRSAWQPRGGGALDQPLGAFKRPSYLRHLPAVHVRLTFLQPTSGPLSLGAGRHCGLGVLAAESSS